VRLVGIGLDLGDCGVRGREHEYLLEVERNIIPSFYGVNPEILTNTDEYNSLI